MIGLMIRVAVLDDHPPALAALEEPVGDTAGVHSIPATAGEARIPETAPDVRGAATAQLASSDVPVASMLLTGTSGIAATLKPDRRDVVRSIGRRPPTVGSRPRPTPNAYGCRRCHATFQPPLPRPYGAICPTCLGDGVVVALTDSPPRRMSPLYPTVADGGHARSERDPATPKSHTKAALRCAPEPPATSGTVRGVRATPHDHASEIT
jgi:hypothetical protein